MKKIIFAALFAIVAIGGAYAIPVYNSAGTYIGMCNSSASPNCDTTGPYYNVNKLLIPPSQLEDYRFSNPAN